MNEACWLSSMICEKLSDCLCKKVPSNEVYVLWLVFCLLIENAFFNWFNYWYCGMPIKSADLLFLLCGKNSRSWMILSPGILLYCCPYPFNPRLPHYTARSYVWNAANVQICIHCLQLYLPVLLKFIQHSFLPYK